MALKLSKKEIIGRYILFVLFIVFLMGGVIWKAYQHAFVDKAIWQELIDKQIRENIEVLAERGNIYDCNGNLLAATTPEYWMTVDFRGSAIQRDSLFNKLDSVGLMLNKLFGEKTQEQYATELKHACNQEHKNYRLVSRRITYLELQKLKKIPYFRLSRYKCGLIANEQMRRSRPYGTLASRTIGDVFGDGQTGGRSGFEQYFNNTLKGANGIASREKVYGRYVTRINKHPERGKDIVTTIDIHLQDIVEKELKKVIKQAKAQAGWCIVMHVKTGEIRAITNMALTQDSTFVESRNFAVADAEQPGSTIKTAALLVGLDDGFINPDEEFDTGNGVYNFKGTIIKDHNAHRGGCGVISVRDILGKSSNIGMIKVIEKYYGNNQKKYFDGLYRIGLAEKLNIPIFGKANPKIKHPDRYAKTQKRSDYISKQTMGSTSFGYETNIPALSMLTFYNGIANGGVMVEPLFVKSINKDGQETEVFEAKVVREHMASPKAIQMIQEMLRYVVTNGTGKSVNSPHITIAGKTGTAVISRGEEGYNGGRNYRMAFCGYFPYEKPEYSCIAIIRDPRQPGLSAGGTAGAVFRNVAEQIYSQSLHTPIDSIQPDTIRPRLPYIKKASAATYGETLKEYSFHRTGEYGKGQIVETETTSDQLIIQSDDPSKKIVPNVIGMGVSDAIYELEQRGIRVTFSGYGRVVSQSISYGTPISRSLPVMTLRLQPVTPKLSRKSLP